MKNILPCVLGLGYVGLPLFLRLQKKYKCLGFDINKNRINTLKKKKDINNEFKREQLTLKKGSSFSYNEKNLKDFNFFIIAVPTPVFSNNKPDLNPLYKASRLIAKNLKKNDIIFIESTVYPGVTRNICKKILEKTSKLKEGIDFCIGYSPERINPGDTKHTIDKINKIVSYNSNNKKTIYKINNVYKNISKKIVFSKTIEEAETAKVIENIQRDLNIALMNEILIISNKLGLNFNKIHKLASSKWNFIKIKPGLVGGHCLPVDPYYLSEIARKNKIPSDIILTGRKVNNDMVKYVISEINKKIRDLKKKKIKKILLVGATYKPNVSDYRNSLAIKIYERIKKNKGIKTDFYDPEINHKALNKFKIKKKVKLTVEYDYYVFLVNHKKNYEIYDYLIKKRKENRIIDLFGFYSKYDKKN